MAAVVEPLTIRERLLDAAADVFAEQGYDRARVQDIARRAGLSTGAIYGNFRDKADLLADAIEMGMRAGVSALRTHVIGPLSSPAPSNHVSRSPAGAG